MRADLVERALGALGGLEGGVDSVCSHLDAVASGDAEDEQLVVRLEGVLRKVNEALSRSGVVGQGSGG